MKRLLLGAGVAAVAVIAVVAWPSPDHTDVRSIDDERLVGAHLIAGYWGTDVPQVLLDHVKEGRVAGVVFYSVNFTNKDDAREATHAVRKAAEDGGLPPPLLLIDQEGATVKRFPDLPPELSPEQIGQADDVAAVAEAEGRATGEALSDLGFNVNLAPIADVDRYPNDEFLAGRSFGSKPAVVAEGACGFARGLEEGGTLAVLKHFPGLGRSKSDSDVKVATVKAPARALESDLAAYKACPDDSTFVMVSNAYYPTLDIDQPAMLDRGAYERLEKTGFKGLTISEAFSTPSIDQTNQAAVAAVNAGLDVLLLGGPVSLEQSPYDDQLEVALIEGQVKRASLEQSAQRIFDLRRQLAQ